MRPESFFGDVKGEHCFYLKEGGAISNIHGLREALLNVDDSIFRHHVNEERNDFSSWIRYCIGDDVLADNMSRSRSRAEMVNALLSRISEMETLVNSDIPSEDIADGISDTPYASQQRTAIVQESQTYLSAASAAMPPEFPDDVPPDVPPDDVPSDSQAAAPAPKPKGTVEDIPPDTPPDMPPDMPPDVPPDMPEEVPSDTPDDVPSDIPADVPSDAPSGVTSETSADTSSDAPPDMPPDESSDKLPDDTPRPADTVSQSAPQAETPAEMPQHIPIESKKTDEGKKSDEATRPEEIRVDKAIEPAPQDVPVSSPVAIADVSGMKPSDSIRAEVKEPAKITGGADGKDDTKEGQAGKEDASKKEILDRIKKRIAAKQAEGPGIPSSPLPAPVTSQASATERTSAPASTGASALSAVTQPASFMESSKPEAMRQEMSTPTSHDDKSLFAGAGYDNGHKRPAEGPKQGIKLNASLATITKAIPGKIFEVLLSPFAGIKARSHKKRLHDKLERMDVQKPGITLPKEFDFASMPADLILRIMGIIKDDDVYYAEQVPEIRKTSSKKERLRLYVPGFDSLVDKGIPKGSTILVTGGPGSGKTTFCIQQLGIAASNGEKCLFMSFEETEESLVEHMESYGLNPRKYIEDGNLVIRKLDPFRISRSVEALLAKARGELLIDINEILDIVPQGLNPDRVVIDSLSAISAAFDESATAYRVYLNQLFEILQKSKATSFLINEVKDVESMSHGTIEEFLADGVIIFYNLSNGNIKQSALEILKMRGTKHQKKIVPFEFVESNGIIVYPMEEIYHFSR